MLYSDNAEPAVEELLTDPIAQLLMSRDGLEMEDVRAHIEDARKAPPPEAAAKDLRRTN